MCNWPRSHYDALPQTNYAPLSEFTPALVANIFSRHLEGHGGSCPELRFVGPSQSRYSNFKNTCILGIGSWRGVKSTFEGIYMDLRTAECPNTARIIDVVIYAGMCVTGQFVPWSHLENDHAVLLPRFRSHPYRDSRIQINRRNITNSPSEC